VLYLRHTYTTTYNYIYIYLLRCLWQSLPLLSSWHGITTVVLHIYTLCYQGYCYIIHLKSWFKDIKLTFQFLILFFNPQSMHHTGRCWCKLFVSNRRILWQWFGGRRSSSRRWSCCYLWWWKLWFWWISVAWGQYTIYYSYYIMLITSSSASTHSTSCTISFFYKHNMFRLWQSNMVTWWKWKIIIS
jgi:hypothetical protein